MVVYVEKKTERYGIPIGSSFCLPVNTQDVSTAIFHSYVQQPRKKQIQFTNKFMPGNCLHCKKEQFVEPH